MDRPWKPLIAGILDLISGVGMLFVCFWLVLAGGITSAIGNIPAWIPGLLFGLAIPLALMAVLAVIGGIFCIRRRIWGLALAGSIAAFFCCFIFGIVAIIFVFLAHDEFK